MEFLYIFIIIVIAFSLKILIKLKTEQAIFLTVCSFFIIEFITGLIVNLNVGYFIILAIAALCFIYLIYSFLAKKIEYKEIFTPGVVLFLLSFCIYYFSSKGAMLHLWDEATHWGTTAKKMAYLGSLWTTGLQTIGSPTFNFVMLTTTGFSESALYLSQWTLCLACIILPLSNIKWRKFYLAVLYFIGVVVILPFFLEYGNLTLYADGLLALFFGSMVIMWFLEKEFSYKKYIWVGAGAFMLVQIKSGTGMSLAILLIAAILFIDTYILNKDNSIKKNTIQNLTTLIILVPLVVISQALYGVLNGNFIRSEESGRLATLYETSPFYLFATIAAIFIFASTLTYLIMIYKDKTSSKLFKRIRLIQKILISVMFIVLAGLLSHVAILRPDFDIRTTSIRFFLAIIKPEIIYPIIAIIILFITNIVLTDKEDRKDKRIFYFMSFIMTSLFIIGVLYSYLTRFSLYEAVILASFERYIATALIFSAMLSLMPLLEKNNFVNKKSIISKIILSIAIIFLITQWTPVYKTVQETSKIANTNRAMQIDSARYVKEKVDINDKVFIVVQGDGGYVFNWMRYELTPITTNGGYWSFGDGGWHYGWKAKQLKQFFIDANYSYLYLLRTDDIFEERFSELFGDVIPLSKTLYKFENSEEIVFTTVE